MILAHHVRRGFDLDHKLYDNPSILKWVYFKFLDLGVDLSGLYLALQAGVYHIKGILGIEFFLVISGFLITGILLKNGLIVLKTNFP